MSQIPKLTEYLRNYAAEKKKYVSFCCLLSQRVHLCYIFSFILHSFFKKLIFILAARSLRNFTLKSNCKDYQSYLILNPIAQDPKLPLKKSYSMCKITTGFLKSCFCPLCILKSSSIQNGTQQHVFSPCAYNVTSTPFSEENKCLTPLFLLALKN